MAEIPNAVIKRLLTKHGDGLRVSGSALDKAVAATEEYIGRLAREAHASAVRSADDHGADIARRAPIG